MPPAKNKFSWPVAVVRSRQFKAMPKRPAPKNTSGTAPAAATESTSNESDAYKVGARVYAVWLTGTTRTCRSPCDVVSCCNNVDYVVSFRVCFQDLAEIIEIRKKDPDDSAGPRKKPRVSDDSSLDEVTCLLVVTTCSLPTLLDSG